MHKNKVNIRRNAHTNSRVIFMNHPIYGQCKVSYRPSGGKITTVFNKVPKPTEDENEQIPLSKKEIEIKQVEAITKPFNINNKKHNQKAKKNIASAISRVLKGGSLTRI
jgi:hypothetical protein